MRATNMKRAISNTRLPLSLMAALLLTAAAYAAAPGINGTSAIGTFALTAQQAFLNQPDGSAVYSWGYGCATAPGSAFFVPPMPNNSCPTMQVPGPTLIVSEGQGVTVTLTNNLPTAAGNTSILFPGFQVTATGGVAGLLTQEAAPGGSVTYTFTASSPGTHAYYSGTQGDLQIEMGLYGAVIVTPASVPANCFAGLAAQNVAAQNYWGETDFRLSQAAYDHPGSCYDREYLFQWGEMDPNIHRQALAQVKAKVGCTAGAAGCSLEVPTEPYHPAYFLINGRSMPDLMDPNYDPIYPHQPYNGNPHMHPGEQVLVRAIGQGRWQHPFHEHGNHVRILGRDGNMVLSNAATTITYPGGTGASGPPLAGLLMFNTDTTPGQAFEGIFYWSGRGLNWDPYGHNPGSPDPLATLPCTPDSRGYNTGFPATDTTYSTTPSATVATAVNYYEWCQDHNKPLEANPFGDVNSGGPATLPNPNIFTNGPWYGGTPYLGPDATIRSSSTLRNDAHSGNSGCETGNTIVSTRGTPTNPTPNCTNLQPSNVQANPPNERGFAFMWHSHNEREITTNNVFPGGMLMMMLVDSREFLIDESQ
jgi:FtsP/CotA-like multicopper oxidase with cupredoxin domain